MPIQVTTSMLIQILIVTIIHTLIFIGLFMIFNRIKKSSSALHIRFLSRVTWLIVIISYVTHVITVIKPEMNLGKWLLGSSALIVAIIGFASQPVISDLVSGFLISVNKPFEIGDRIIVEGYEPGVVEDITLRHTVIKIYDGIRIIIPNSQLNSKAIQNTSYKQNNRGVHLQFAVSYDTDIQQAANVIRDSVAESPYTHGIENNGIKEDSCPVYFLKFADSSLILETTIYVTPDVSTYIATTDVNTRVLNNFRAKNIEIPYQYINIINSKETKASVQPEKTAVKTTTQPLQRHFRTDTLKLYKLQNPIEASVRSAAHFANQVRMDKKRSNQLQLLSEEAVNMMQDLLLNSKGTFYIEGTGRDCTIHIHMLTDTEKQDYQKLLDLSTSGQNAVQGGIYKKICTVIRDGLGFIQNESKNNYKWSFQNDEKQPGDEDDLGKTLLVAIADNINVTVTHKYADITIKICP